jgi:hypothetical protein
MCSKVVSDPTNENLFEWGRGQVTSSHELEAYTDKSFVSKYPCLRPALDQVTASGQARFQVLNFPPGQAWAEFTLLSEIIVVVYKPGRRGLPVELVIKVAQFSRLNLNLKPYSNKFKFVTIPFYHT